MKKFGLILSSIIAFPFAILLIVLIPLIFGLLNTRQVLFDSSQLSLVIKDVLHETNLLREGVLWLSSGENQERFVQTFNLSEENEQYMNSFFAGLDENDWNQLEMILIQDSFISDWTEQAIESTISWIESSDETPSIVFDMSGYKSYLLGETVEDVVAIVTDALPPCKTNERQTDEMCVLEGEVQEAQITLMEDTFRQGISNIPDEYDIPQNMLENELQIIDLTLSQMKIVIRGIRLVPWVLLGFPVVIALLIYIITGRNPGRSSLWVGIPLIVAGFNTFLLGTISNIVMPSIVNLVPLSESLPPSLQQEFQSTMAILLTPVLEPMSLQGIVVLVPGLILLIIGSIVTVSSEKREVSETIEVSEEKLPRGMDSEDTDQDEEDEVGESTIVL